MIPPKKTLYYFLKGLDGIITPIILLMTKIIFMDSSIYSIFEGKVNLLTNTYLKVLSD